MKFKVIDFDLRIKPSKKAGHVLVIYKTEYLEEHTIECHVNSLQDTLEMVTGTFIGTAVPELKKLEKDTRLGNLSSNKAF